MFRFLSFILAFTLFLGALILLSEIVYNKGLEGFLYTGSNSFFVLEEMFLEPKVGTESIVNGEKKTNPRKKNLGTINKNDRLNRIEYNNIDLIVELGVGLCSLPMPVDYNNNGLTDLIVTAGQDVPDGYTYFFENTGKKKDGIEIFKPGVLIGPKHEYFTPSYVDGELRVLAFNREYDVKDLENSWEIYPEPNIHWSPGRVRANQWSYADYNGNGVLDLIVGVGDWAEYGWDDAFNNRGEWIAGPLRGFVYLIKNKGNNETPVYSRPVKINTTKELPIEVYGRPSPNLADFNGNGKLDFIMGEFVDKLTFFKNVGTREEPVYASGVILTSEGEPIRLRGSIIRPTAYDWTQNGHMDLIVGAEDGSVSLIKNTGEVDEFGVPIFKPPVFFQQIAHEVKGGVLVTPYSTDWNGNGREDIIAGTASGHIFFIENLGGYPPKWGAPQYLEADGEVIRILAGENGSIQGPAEAKWGYTVLSVADWNGNGLPDILVNSIWGKVLWYENIGTRTEPKLAAAQPIEVEWEGETPKPVWNWWDPEGKELVTQWRSTVQAIDLNENGLMDLVALDQEGFLAFYERREIDGELKLMPPQRIFFTAEDSPSVFNQRHQAYSDRTYSRDLMGYDENGSLAYLGVNRRSTSPWNIEAVFRTLGLFQEDQLLDAKKIGAKPLRLNGSWAGWSGRRKFHLTDWNGNGKLDLLVNSENVNVLENIAEKPGQFVFSDTGKVDDFRLAGHTTNPAIVKWSNDKLPNLLIGAEDGYLYYMKNPYNK